MAHNGSGLRRGVVATNASTFRFSARFGNDTLPMKIEIRRLTPPCSPPRRLLATTPPCILSPAVFSSRVATPRSGRSQSTGHHTVNRMAMSTGAERDAHANAIHNPPADRKIARGAVTIYNGLAVPFWQLLRRLRGPLERQLREDCVRPPVGALSYPRVEGAPKRKAD